MPPSFWTWTTGWIVTPFTMDGEHMEKRGWMKENAFLLRVGKMGIQRELGWSVTSILVPLPLPFPWS